MDAVCSIDRSADTVVMSRWLAELAKRPFAELEALPESLEREVGSDAQPLKAVLWKDELSDGRLRLVLQTTGGPSFCCVGGIEAAGIVVAPDGTWSEAPDDLMFEFRMD